MKQITPTTKEMEANKQIEERFSSILSYSERIKSPEYTRVNEKGFVLNLIFDILNILDPVEEIGTSNTGFFVNIFQKYAGLGIKGGYSWCLALMQYVIAIVCEKCGIMDLLPYDTGGTRKLWNICKQKELTVYHPSDCSVGDLLIMAHNSTEGHVWIIKGISEANQNTHAERIFTLVSGNTMETDNVSKMREGGQIAVAEMKASKYPWGEKAKVYPCILGAVSFDNLFMQNYNPL